MCIYGSCTSGMYEMLSFVASQTAKSACSCCRTGILKMETLLSLKAVASIRIRAIFSHWGVTFAVVDLGWFLGFHGTPLWAGSTTRKVLMIG